MKIVVISPETFEAREPAVLAALFAEGLERYHVRKPAAGAAELEAWLCALPEEWRGRLVLHTHHELVGKLGLGGRHFRDGVEGADGDELGEREEPTAGTRAWTSRSCHDLPALRAALGRYDAVLLAPVFTSISKSGHGPDARLKPEAIAAALAARTARERRAEVFALGGITTETAARAGAMGFDGVAVLGAVWHAKDSVAAFQELQASLHAHAA